MIKNTNLNKKTSEFEVTVVADKALWKSEQEKSFEHLAKNLAIKGFRKGHVPTDVARKHIANNDIFSHAIQHLLKELVKEAAKEVKEDTMVLDAPTYNVEKIDATDLEIKFVYPVYPEIKLPDYKALGVKLVEEKVTDKTVEEEFDKILESQAKAVTKAGAVEKNDLAVIDFEGFIDGKPFEGGKAQGHHLVIGSGHFIPGFEDQLIGLKAGDEKDVNVTFPEEYHSEELKGKPAVFKVKLHDVKSKAKPEMTDELAKSINAPGVETVAQLKDYIKTVFAEQYRQQARAKFQREAFDKILASVEIAIPAAILGKEMAAIFQKMEADMKAQGISIQQYMQFTGQDPVKLDAQLRTQAESRLRDAFIFAEIARIEKLELTDADYEAEYEKLAKVYGQSVDGIKGVITKQQMQIPMTNDRVIDLLIANNK